MHGANAPRGIIGKDERRNMCSSETRILLALDLMRDVRRPSRTVIQVLRRVIRGQDLALAFHELHRETLRNVPYDMAVQVPHPRVIRDPRQDEMPAG